MYQIIRRGGPWQRACAGVSGRGASASAEGLRRTRGRRVQSAEARGDVRRSIHRSGRAAGWQSRAEGAEGADQQRGPGEASAACGPARIYESSWRAVERSRRRQRDALSLLWLWRRIALGASPPSDRIEAEPCLASHSRRTHLRPLANDFPSGRLLDAGPATSEPPGGPAATARSPASSQVLQSRGTRPQPNHDTKRPVGPLLPRSAMLLLLLPGPWDAAYVAAVCSDPDCQTHMHRTPQPDCPCAAVETQGLYHSQSTSHLDRQTWGEGDGTCHHLKTAGGANDCYSVYSIFMRGTRPVFRTA